MTLFSTSCIREHSVPCADVFCLVTPGLGEHRHSLPLMVMRLLFTGRFRLTLGSTL